MSDYDVIIVGSGAGGGTTAGILAEAGKRVLLLERGKALSYAEVGQDHLRSQRLSIYGHNAGPDIDGNPRVYVEPDGREHIVRPHEGGYNNNAATLGGGTLVYGAQSWRFMPQDFRMASIYGVPDGSSLADWPITYEDLEPYYERAEWEIGVAGDGDKSHRFIGPRRKEYPMPPVPDNPQRLVLEEGAKKLGWNTLPVPLLINTKPYGGRAACIQCRNCVGFACPSDAKNGSQNTMIPRALATGNCTLVTEAMAERIETNAQGEVTGVTYLIDRPEGIARVTATARQVVVSGGAIESARLLLNSRSERHPNGLGNHYDQVGRHLQGHYYPSATGFMPESVYDGLGPGPSIATTQFNHGNPGIIGGGMLANEFIKMPMLFWSWNMPPELPRWGLACKQFMRENYTRVIQIQGPVQEIPSPEGRVTVDPSVRDKYGIPVARFSGTTHPETVRTSEYMRDRAVDWLEATGARGIFAKPIALGLSGGQHQSGTCRMGDDPAASVTDRWGRVHGHENLFVVDGGLHVTNGGFNPVLTILALAFRSAEHIASL